jgi:MoaA/NifB/PqqE/SkfB family radical SAM enzyme
LVPERADVIRQIDTLQLSLDGNRAPHDQLRGKGAFDGLIAAVDTAQTLGIKVSFNTTLTRNNLDQVPWILDFAGQNNAQADFQPISDVHAPQAQIAALLPDSDDFAKTIRLLKIRKSEGAPVANSQACLDFLANYPTPTQIPCSAGRLITRIDPAGMLFPCNQLREERSWPNAVELGFEKAFAKLPKVGCKNCWCSATVELNLIHSFNVGAIRNRFNAR